MGTEIPALPPNHAGAFVVAPTGEPLRRQGWLMEIPTKRDSLDLLNERAAA